MKAALVSVMALLGYSLAHAQSPQRGTGKSAEGSLTVTAVVDSSVSFVMKPDGTQQVIVANAPDGQQFFYRPAVPATKTARGSTKQAVIPAAFKKGPVDKRKLHIPVHRPAPISYDLWETGSKLEVKQQTIRMNVVNTGRTQATEVRVTTVVVR